MRKSEVVLILISLICSTSFGQAPVASYSFNNGNADADVGTLHGIVYGASLTDDRFGNANAAYDFDGGDYIGFSAIDPIGNNSDVSACLWLKPATHVVVSDTLMIVTANDQYLLSTGGEAASVGYAMVWNNGSVVSCRRTNSSEGTTQYSGFADDGTWSHTCFVYDHSAGEIKLYLDGDAIDLGNSSAASYTHSTNGFQIGQTCVAGQGLNFEGAIDDLILYDVALTDADVDSLYNLLDPLHVPELQVEKSLEIFPNPTNGLVNFEMQPGALTLVIYDLTGKCVQTSVLTGTGYFAMNTDVFEAGTYVAKVIYEDVVQEAFFAVTD